MKLNIYKTTTKYRLDQKSIGQQIDDTGQGEKIRIQLLAAYLIESNLNSKFKQF